MQDEFQFYQTSHGLARKAWGLFKNRNFERILDPEAGRGALLKAFPTRTSFSVPKLDVIELDLTHHDNLRAAGYNVVGTDFLDFREGNVYSHIIMNPPFQAGAQHVLHAWDILWDGEIVAILNAETLWNPYSKERKYLAQLIETHGSVQFIDNAFSGAERSTDVSVALIYLKKSTGEALLLEDLVGDLDLDPELDLDLQGAQEVMLPNSDIVNAVRAFNAAWAVTQKAVIARAQANRYQAMLGHTLTGLGGKHDSLHELRQEAGVAYVRRTLKVEYDEMKDRAWANVLRSTEVLTKTSNQVQRSLEREFEKVKQLSFTVKNIYGFLLGLAQNSGQIQIDMACEVFDSITRYRSDNTVYYMGWKSNDRHRTAGMRIKTKRFVLPEFEGHANGLCWDEEAKLGDLDKVFAMLDGKREPEVSLVQVFRDEIARLRAGERVSASYFDVRYYPGRGTIHFFARSQALVDRLNLLVGRQRQWLPPVDANVNPAFWEQYQRAELFDKAVRQRVRALQTKNPDLKYVHPFLEAASTAENAAPALELIGDGLAVVLEEHGVSLEACLTHEKTSTGVEMLLLARAST